MTRILEPPKLATPPCDKWQTRARGLVAEAQASLWSGAGTRALTWLRKRGFSEDAARAAGLGYVTADTWEEREAWGLEPEISSKTGRPKRVWIPRGLAVPWYIGSELWRLNIRRSVKANETPKYYSLPGFGHGLYGADRLEANKPAVLLEGELDVLVVSQKAGDLVTPVATGGPHGSRRAHWVAKLARCSRVLVAFDADDEGDQARRWWLSILDNGKCWRPFWGDVSSMHQDGCDLRAWVETGLG